MVKEISKCEVLENYLYERIHNEKCEVEPNGDGTKDFWTWCWAKNKEHAVKIANERLDKYKTNRINK